MPVTLTRLSATLALAFFAACAQPEARRVTPPEAAVPAPPVAEQRPHEVTGAGRTRLDEYYWLRDDARTNPEVIAYLEAENAYANAVLEPTETLQETLFAELISRVKEDEASVPYRKGDWWYYTRYVPGGEHPVYARRRGSPDGPEQVMLDVNAMAAGHDYFVVGGLAVSHDGRLLAWADDAVGREEYTLRVKDLASGETLGDHLENVSGDLAWANDGRTLFYVRRQEGTLIPHQVWRHRLGSPPDRDVLVYEEPDPTYFVALEKSRDRRHVLIGSFSTLTTEYRVLDADRPEGAPRLLLPRQAGHEYYAELVGDQAWLRTNREAPDFRLVRAPIEDAADPRRWEEIVPAREKVLLNDFAVFDEHLVVEERESATLGLRIMDLDGGSSRPVDAGGGASTAYLHDNPNVDTRLVRYAYTSMVEPVTVVDFDMETGERTVLKVEDTPNYDASRYETRRIHAPARDGERIPVTLLYAKGVKPDGTAPLMVYGYGSYGASMDPDFDQRLFSLVDRGFVWAIVHVRGGEEFGRRWYEDGKLLNKQNTFSDFVDATRHLVDRGWGDPARIAAMGRSAGGLLMGAIANQAPQLYRAIVAGVPFVDVVTTMLDESIPLTTFEFDEWGDPDQPLYYDYMLAYSPYDQVSAQDYPAIYASAGLWDPRVQYWEPAKWVARLRDRRREDDGDPILLVTEMSAGHFASAGRYENLRDTAREYAFVLQQLGLAADAAVAAGR